MADPTSPPTPPPPAALAERLQQLEEGLAFSEREHEQLGAQVTRLQQQVMALTRRLADVESTQRAGKNPANPGDPNEQDGPGDGED